MREHVQRVEETTNSNKQQLSDLAEENVKMKQNIDTLYRLSNEFRTEMDELGEKVAELSTMKKQLSVRTKERFSIH